MSLSKTVIKAGFSLPRARANVPDLCRQVEERYATHCREYKEMMHQKKVESVRSAITELQQQGKSVKPHTVMKFLKERGATCIWVLREIARAELKRLRLSATVA